MQAGSLHFIILLAQGPELALHIFHGDLPAAGKRLLRDAAGWHDLIGALEAGQAKTCSCMQVPK